jgi:hypothetical protein
MRGSNRNKVKRKDSKVCTLRGFEPLPEGRLSTQSGHLREGNNLNEAKDISRLRECLLSKIPLIAGKFRSLEFRHIWQRNDNNGFSFATLHSQ